MLAKAAGCGVRAVLVLSGNAPWCREQASRLIVGQPKSSLWWLGRYPPTEVTSLTWDKARTRLGHEVEWLVIDAHDGFDAEGFGALTGTIAASGMLLLLTPPLDEWPDFPDPEQQRFVCYRNTATDVSGHFLTRLIERLKATEGIALWQEGEALPEIPVLRRHRMQEVADAIYANGEQQRAVASIRHVAEWHSHRPLVLSADRGRGKSAALGIAAAQLLHGKLDRIVVTAPRISATDALFEHAALLLPGCEKHRGKLLWQGGTIEFVAPDALLQASHHMELLLVDEAAAIPASMLGALLEQYPRIVFATTIHGYEGTGRGFALRFQQILNQMTPGWQSLHLSAPVRWAEGDPLERFSFDALLLDAEPVAEAEVVDAKVEDCCVERIEVAQLVENETDLRELFGLLVLAHYRTSPNDLRQLLDAPRQSLYVLRYVGHIVAVAIVAHEGGLDMELARQVMLGRRRVQGHLLPQSLANHAGLSEAAQRRIARIMRIAVHPALQRRGLGGFLLQQLKQIVTAEGSDLLGASFGADVSLLHFWFSHDFLPVRLGLGREASSGSHAVMVLSPLSEDGQAIFVTARERFTQVLPELLAEPLAGLESELADMLLAVTPPHNDMELDDYDWSDLESFAFGLRGYENCMSAIRKLVLLAWSDGTAKTLEGTQRTLLEEKVLQRHTWPLLCRQHSLAGRKAALQAVRQAIAVLYSHYRDK